MSSGHVFIMSLCYAPALPLRGASRGGGMGFAAAINASCNFDAFVVVLCQGSRINSIIALHNEILLAARDSQMKLI